jgi:membrane protease YdiL (CAAX protease family)
MQKTRAFLQRHPATVYFGIAFLLSYGGFLIVDAPKILRGETIQPLDALLLFPVLVIGVGLAGIALTAIIDGRSGLRDLFSRIGRWRVGARWYAVLLLPPCLLLALLLTLRTLVSPSFAPGFFPIGIIFGLIAGFFEEIGWTGYAFPKMQGKYSVLSTSILLGVLWGLWHAPVVDYLGTATPHGAYWLPFFLAFIAMVTALRVLIVWIYSNTKSILLAMLLHACNTGFLAILAPAHISAAQETLSYALYAAILWIVVALVVARYGKILVRQPMQVAEVEKLV